MKRGQLLSQPFFYIFAIIVIGLLLVFGYRAISGTTSFANTVGFVKMIDDIKKNVNEMNRLFPGSSTECVLLRAGASTKNECEIIIPNEIKGLCFIDTNSAITFSEIPYNNVKEEVQVVQASGDKNLFFATTKQPINPIQIPKLKPINFCLDMAKKNPSFILENKGKYVEARKS